MAKTLTRDVEVSGFRGEKDEPKSVGLVASTVPGDRPAPGVSLTIHDAPADFLDGLKYNDGFTLTLTPKPPAEPKPDDAESPEA